MEKYKELLDLINAKSNWSAESEFFCDVITKGTIRLLEYCYEDLEQEKNIRIYPMLRQVQENCVSLVALGSEVLTTKQFVEGDINPQKIFREMTKKSDNDKNKIEILSIYMKSIKDVLNDYSHANFNGLMHLFTEEYQTFDTRRFNKVSGIFMIFLVEAVFIPAVNYLYNIKIPAPRSEPISSELKKIGSLKYTIDHLPEGYKEFFNNSTVLKGYYSNLISDFKRQITETKDLLKQNPK